jgi:hypothetical protein
MDFLDKWKVSRDTRRIVEDEPARTRGDEGTEEAVPTAGESKITESRRIYQATYRNKNKASINAQRRMQEQEPVGSYKKARRRAKYKGQAWNISFENWYNVWNSCPRIFDDSLDIYQHAWQMRSGDIQKGTQMRRLDTNKGWQVGNVAIYYRNQRVPEHGIVAPWDFKLEKPAYEVTLNNEH